MESEFHKNPPARSREIADRTYPVHGERPIQMNAIRWEKNKLGFIGIGHMGLPIARRLLEAGFKLTAYDRNRSKAEELIRYGGTVAESVGTLASSCNVVLSCLPNEEAVLRVS